MIILTAPIPNLKYQKESRQAANHGCCERAKWKFLMIMMFMLMILMIDDFKDDGGKSSWHQPVPVDVIDNQTLHAFLGGWLSEDDDDIVWNMFSIYGPFALLWSCQGYEHPVTKRSQWQVCFSFPPVNCLCRQKTFFCLFQSEIRIWSALYSNIIIAIDFRNNFLLRGLVDMEATWGSIPEGLNSLFRKEDDQEDDVNSSPLKEDVKTKESSEKIKVK